jgi:hypothetical protein
MTSPSNTNDNAVHLGNAVLACVLLGADWTEFRAATLEDFPTDDQKKIFAAMSRLSGTNMQADITLLKNELGADTTAYAAVLDLRADGTVGTNPRRYVQELKKETLRTRRVRLAERMLDASPEEQDAITQQLLAVGSVTNSTAPAGLQIKFLSSVKAQPQGWLWEMHIPNNQLLGLYGPSHTAKSIIAADWMARVTTAAKWPDGIPGIAQPRKVLMLAPGEDALDTVVKPRIVLAGGDPDRVAYIEAVGRFDDQGNIFEDMASLDRDIPALARIIRDFEDKRSLLC